MDKYEWDGRLLPGGHIALVPLALGPHPHRSGEDNLILLAAHAGTTGVVLCPHQIERFIGLHSDRCLDCLEAARLHWVLERHFRDAAAVTRSILWEFSRTGRLVDITLLDRLTVLAVRGDISTRTRSLPLIARDHGVSGPPNGRETDFVLDSKIEQLNQLSAPGIRDALFHVAGCVWNLAAVLGRRAVELAVVANSSAQTFGPLGLTLQVQGAIAIAEEGQSGLILPEFSRTEILNHCESSQRRAHDLLIKDPKARFCIRRDSKGVTRVDNDGNPVLRKNILREWLTTVLENMRCLHGYRLNLQLYRKGDIPLDPRDWGYLTSCDRVLDAWVRLVRTGHLRRWLLHHKEGVVRTKYEVLTRLSTVTPDLELMRAFAGTGCLFPNPGHRFLVVGLPALELRALASVASAFHENPVLPRVLSQGTDPIAFAAQRLFDGATASEPALIRHTRALLCVAPWGLDDTLAGIAARQLFGLDDLRMAEFPAHLRRLVEEVYPELGAYRRDDLAWRLSQNMFTDPDTLSQDLIIDLSPINRRLLRNVLAGEIAGTPANFLWGYLNGNNRNNTLRAPLAARQGGANLYKSLLGAFASTRTGRIRGGLFFHETNTSEYLDLADDARKAVLYAFVRSGHRLAGAIGDDFAFEVAESQAGDRAYAEAMATLAREAAQAIFGNIPVVSEVTWQDAW